MSDEYVRDDNVVQVAVRNLFMGGAPEREADYLAVIVLAAISWIVLNRVQEPVNRAFATPPYTRVGD